MDFSSFNGSSSPLREDDVDFSSLPLTFVLSSTNLPTDTLHDLEDVLIQRGTPLTYDATEARLFITSVSTAKRAHFELRHVDIWTLKKPHSLPPPQRSSQELIDDGPPPAKKAKYIDGVGLDRPEADHSPSHAVGTHIFAPIPPDEVKVVRAKWVLDCLSKRELLPLDDFILFEGQKVSVLEYHKAVAIECRKYEAGQEISFPPSTKEEMADPEAILERARADTPPPSKTGGSRFVSAPHGKRRFRDQISAWHERDKSERPVLLELETHSSQEEELPKLPPAPAWVEEMKVYSCERITPADSPNKEYIDCLKKVRLARILTGDEIGVRAYSSSIAAISSLTTKIVHPREILRLPSCDVKIANLWIEFENSGAVAAASEVDTDEHLKVLQLFYDIWGVGAQTAREFYYKGWTSLEDVIKYGWEDLSRVQKIGAKFYDEFKLGIPRNEVEHILEIVRTHAVKVRDEGIEALIVGGYRRGQGESGDVDIILSHRDLEKTAYLVEDVVKSLEDDGWITHTLTLALTSTKRGQSTLQFKNMSGPSLGQGFDTLDKALVVWQDFNWPNKERDLEADPTAQNPNAHRRVDIIVSPWRTVGCAVLGWSGGTTFQRDVRRYAKDKKEWKFDSSGIRSRRTGNVVELEGRDGVDGSMIDAEKAVFKGLGLEYREPWERCTG